MSKSSRASISDNVSDILRRKLKNQRSMTRELRHPPPTPSKPRERPPTPEECSVPIADGTVADVKAKLGLIDMCFPHNPTPAFEQRTEFPESYKRLGSKEKLVLLFAENFRRQYKERFPHRKPLILALPNECDVQKFVCTTLRPSVFLFPDLIGSWEEVASFVADYIVYEPLVDQVNMVSTQHAQGFDLHASDVEITLNKIVLSEKLSKAINLSQSLLHNNTPPSRSPAMAETPELFPPGHPSTNKQTLLVNDLFPM